MGAKEGCKENASCLKGGENSEDTAARTDPPSESSGKFREEAGKKRSGGAESVHLDASCDKDRPAKRSKAIRYLVKEKVIVEEGCEKWASASPAARKDIETKALFANVIRGNAKAVAEEKGIPFDVFRAIWAEYRETRQYEGTAESVFPPAS